jgi:hypothetical protein
MKPEACVSTRNDARRRDGEHQLVPTRARLVLLTGPPKEICAGLFSHIGWSCALLARLVVSLVRSDGDPIPVGSLTLPSPFRTAC